MGSEAMKLELILTGGVRIIVADACEHDLNIVRDCMAKYHRRWLLKRKQHVIQINTTTNPVVVCTKDIMAVRIL